MEKPPTAGVGPWAASQQSACLGVSAAPASAAGYFFASLLSCAWVPALPEVFALSVDEPEAVPEEVPVALLPVALPVDDEGGVVVTVVEEEDDGLEGAVEVAGGVVVVVELLLEAGGVDVAAGLSLSQAASPSTHAVIKTSCFIWLSLCRSVRPRGDARRLKIRSWKRGAHAAPLRL